MRTCEKCIGGKVMIVGAHYPCPHCHGSGVTSAPRSEGPRKLKLDDVDADTDKCADVEEWEDITGRYSGLLYIDADGVLLDADAERQLYELLRLRAEQGPPREGI